MNNLEQGKVIKEHSKKQMSSYLKQENFMEDETAVTPFICQQSQASRICWSDSEDSEDCSTFHKRQGKQSSKITGAAQIQQSQNLLHLPAFPKEPSEEVHLWWDKVNTIYFTPRVSPELIELIFLTSQATATTKAISDSNKISEQQLSPSPRNSSGKETNRSFYYSQLKEKVRISDRIPFKMQKYFSVLFCDISFVQSVLAVFAIRQPNQEETLSENDLNIVTEKFSIFPATAGKDISLVYTRRVQADSNSSSTRNRKLDLKQLEPSLSKQRLLFAQVQQQVKKVSFHLLNSQNSQSPIKLITPARIVAPLQLKLKKLIKLDSPSTIDAIKISTFLFQISNSLTQIIEDDSSQNSHPLSDIELELLVLEAQLQSLNARQQIISWQTESSQETDCQGLINISTTLSDHLKWLIIRRNLLEAFSDRIPYDTETYFQQQLEIGTYASSIQNQSQWSEEVNIILSHAAILAERYQKEVCSSSSVNRFNGSEQRQKGQKKKDFGRRESGSRSKLIEIDCSVCFHHKNDENNTVVYCSMCCGSFHKYCYGIPFIPDGRFLCKKCEVVEKMEGKEVGGCYFSCQICSEKKLPVTNIIDGTGVALFYHLTCLYIFNYAVYDKGCVRFREGITHESIKLDIVNAKSNSFGCCKICGVDRGLCVKCSGTSCQYIVHPLCAYLCGEETWLEEREEDARMSERMIQSSFETVEFLGFNLRLKCSVHADKINRNCLEQMYYRRFQINYARACSSKTFNDYESRVKKRKNKHSTDISQKQELIEDIKLDEAVEKIEEVKKDNSIEWKQIKRQLRAKKEEIKLRIARLKKSKQRGDNREHKRLMKEAILLKEEKRKLKQDIKAIKNQMRGGSCKNLEMIMKVKVEEEPSKVESSKSDEVSRLEEKQEFVQKSMELNATPIEFTGKETDLQIEEGQIDQFKNTIESSFVSETVTIIKENDNQQPKNMIQLAGLLFDVSEVSQRLFGNTIYQRKKGESSQVEINVKLSRQWKANLRKMLLQRQQILNEVKEEEVEVKVEEEFDEKISSEADEKDNAIKQNEKIEEYMCKVEEDSSSDESEITIEQKEIQNIDIGKAVSFFSVDESQKHIDQSSDNTCSLRTSHDEKENLAKSENRMKDVEDDPKYSQVQEKLIKNKTDDNYPIEAQSNSKSTDATAARQQSDTTLEIQELKQ